MSELIDMQGSVPQWDLSDRMRKALRFADLGVQEMADYLGVTRNTVGNWINGRIEPSTQTLRLWALRTGVPYEWLQNGDTPTGPTPGPDHPLGGDPLSPYFRSPTRYVTVCTPRGNAVYDMRLRAVPVVERARAS